MPHTLYAGRAEFNLTPQWNLCHQTSLVQEMHYTFCEKSAGSRCLL